MKNNKWLLGVIFFLSSCSNNMFQIEDDSLSTIEKEAILSINEEQTQEMQSDNIDLLNTNDSQKTIYYPAMSFSINHESFYVHDEVVITVPKLDQDYIYNTEGKHPGFPKYNISIGSHCYIQYRIHSNGSKHPWYYYHPDTILSKESYLIEVKNYHPDDLSRLFTVRLNAARLPKASFDVRGILVGGAEFNGEYVSTVTKWLPDNWSYEPWTENFNGFENNNSDNNNPNRQIVDVRAQLHFSVTMYIDRSESGIYELRFGNQIVRKPYTKGESLITHTFTEELFFKAYLNSHYSIKRSFEGKDYDFNFYISPGYRGEMLYASAEAYKYH